MHFYVAEIEDNKIVHTQKEGSLKDALSYASLLMWDKGFPSEKQDLRNHPNFEGFATFKYDLIGAFKEDDNKRSTKVVIHRCK